MTSFLAHRALLWGVMLLAGALIRPAAGSEACAQPTDDIPTTYPEAPLFRAAHVGVDAGGGVWTTASFWGKTPEARMGFLAMHVQRPIAPPARTSVVRLHYVATVMPAIVLDIPASALPPRKRTETPPDGLPDFRGLGIGVAPLGLQLNIRLRRAVQPYVRTTTGVMYFFSSMPDRRGTHLNFTLGIGTGVQTALTDRILLTLGYRYQHLSNGFRGDINPGVDSHLFHLGLARTW